MADKDKPKAKRGRPAYKADDKTKKAVNSLSAVGTTQEDIAEILKIDLKTLRKYYRHELDTAAVSANASVAGALYKNAMNGNVSAQIFWCKTRLKWRETDSINDNEDVKPVKVIIEVEDGRRD